MNQSDKILDQMITIMEEILGAPASPTQASAFAATMVKLQKLKVLRALIKKQFLDYENNSASIVSQINDISL